MQYDLPLPKEKVSTLSEVLNFINKYWYKKTIEFTSFYFEDGIEFNYENSLTFFHWLLNLHLERVIDLEIKWSCENEMWRKNKKINLFLKENLETGLLNFSAITGKKHKKIYDIIFIERNIEYFKNNILPNDYLLFDIRVYWNRLLELLFQKIHHELGYENIKHRDISQNLYNNILEQTWWKNNFLDKITIFYHFYNDYIKDNRIVLPLLSELEEKWKLKIKNIKLEDEYIFFEFDKINDISENLFIKTVGEIVKIPNSKWEVELKYEENNFILNNKYIDFKSQKSKIYQIFLLAFDSFNKYKKNHVNFDEINSVILENSDKYSTISSKDLINYDNSLRKNIEEKNKSIEKSHNVSELIGINKSWILCQYYTPEKQ
jgi:thiol-disulfide isomerase/thioredoxin